MKPDYEEGPKALDKFNQTLTTLFRAPKTLATKAATAKKPTRKRAETSKG